MRPQVFGPAGAGYELIRPDTEGWIVSTVLGVRLRRVDGTPPRLRIEGAGDPSDSVSI